MKHLITAATAALVFNVAATNAQSIAVTQKVGDNIYQPVVNQVDGAVYISAAGSSKIYKLDPKTLVPVDSIALENAPMGLGISNKNQTLYSTSRNALVTATDLKTGKQTSIANPVKGASAREVFVDDTRNKVYVTSVRAGGGIWVIDGATNTFEKYIYNLGSALTGGSIDSKTNTIYATAMGDNKVIVVDAETGVVQKRFAAHGERPTNVFFEPTGNRLFVANQATENITVLDAEKGELIATVPTGKGALGINYNPEKDHIYVANRHGKTVSVIDGKTYKVIKTLEMEALPNTVAINFKTGDVYVTNKQAAAERGSKEKPAPVKNGDTVSLIKD